MKRIRFRCEAVPPQDIIMLTNVVGGGSVERFVGYAIDFGMDIAPRLASGAKIATGNDVRGYRTIDITLRGKMERIGNIAKENIAEISDIEFQRLARVGLVMGCSAPEFALPRLVYWMWITSQINWMYLPVYVMDHRREEWFEYIFRPILDVRDLLEY